MQIRVIDQIDDPFLKSEWERLEKEGDVFPQSSYHWCATWWKHLGGGRRLHVVVVVDEQGKALAIAPLCIERTVCIRVLRSFPVNYTDFFQIVMSPQVNHGAVFELIHGYCSQYHLWQAVVLTPVNDHATLFEFLRTKGTAERHLIGNIVADISAVSWDKYLGTLSRNRRRLSNKKMQALEADHQVEVELVVDEPAYASYFDRIREIQELRATKDRAGRSDLYMKCVRETNGHLFANGRMVLYLIKADGIVISYRIGILKGRTYYDWNTNYDISFSDYSPGLIGLAYVIRDLIGRGITTLDFMAGVYDYKLSYSPKHEMRNNYLFVMGNRSIRSWLYCKYQMEWREKIKIAYHKALNVVSRGRRLLRQPRDLMVDQVTCARDRVRQFGLRAVLRQFVRAAFRPVFAVERNILFTIPDFRGYTFYDPCIVPLTRQRIERAAAAGELNETHVRLLTGFIDEGSSGVCAEVDGKLAGYAWVQFEGEYTFGHTGRMTIPPQHAVFKNLLIVPKFRGCKLGQKLNAARLALVPSGVTPVVFIIPENRYAIRNWEHYGFRQMISVTRWRWLGQQWRMRLIRLSDYPAEDPVLKALENSNNV